jgi:hypothetical protein
MQLLLPNKADCSLWIEIDILQPTSGAPPFRLSSFIRNNRGDALFSCGLRNGLVPTWSWSLVQMKPPGYLPQAGGLQSLIWRFVLISQQQTWA